MPGDAVIDGRSIRGFAGIDGGASKTRVRVIDLDGRLIGEGAAGPGSLTLSPEAAADNCRQALRRALAGSGIEPASCRLVCGLAGHRHSRRRAAFEQRLHDLDLLDVISDGYAALLGAHRAAPGAIVIAGTGSVALCLQADGFVRQVGGFGPVCGDEGGGNWLGREAVRATLKAMDEAASGECQITPLSALLIDHMGREHEAIVDWVTTADATRFASLVPMILDYASSGDPLAGRLLDAAAAEVGRLLSLIGGHGLPIALLGGLARDLEPRLPPDIRSSLTSPLGDAMDGALLMAEGLAPSEVYA